jgi:hypothetical protein
MSEELVNKTTEKTTMNITLHRNVTSNVSRTTFDYIRDNAGVTRADATTALEHAGFNAGSVTSLIGQMLKNRLIRNENGGLYANQKEYTPLKALKPAFKHTKKRAYIPRKKMPGVWQPMPVLMPSPTPAEWTVDSVIGSLSVRQALAVHMELKKIFGE